MKKKTSRKTDTFGEAGKPIRKDAYRWREDITDVVVTDGVTKIGDFAFAGCSHLKSIVIPDSVTKIGEGAFEGCRSLILVHLPRAESGLDLGSSAFERCFSLESVIFSGPVKKIKPRTFAGCSALKYIDFQENVEEIESYAFQDCTSLVTVDLLGGLKTIKALAFVGCTAMRFISIPEGVTHIGVGAFCRCSALRWVILPRSLKELDPSAFNGCVQLEKLEYSGDAFRFEGGAMLSGDGRKLLRWMGWLPAFSKVAKVPDSVTEVAASAFEYLDTLETICLPDSITKISGHAFDGCVRLEKIEYSGTAFRLEGGAMLSGDGKKLLRWMGWIPAFSKMAKVPASVTEVGDSAFGNLRELKEIHLPDRVTNIANNAFDGCNSLEKVEFSGTAFRFEGGAMLSGDGTKLLRWIGRLPADKIAKVPDSVIEVGDSAFDGRYELQKVLLPDGVAIIGSRAFRGGFGLSSLHIPETVKHIGKDAFWGCEVPSLVRYISKSKRTNFSV